MKNCLIIEKSLNNFGWQKGKTTKKLGEDAGKV